MKMIRMTALAAIAALAACGYNNPMNNAAVRTVGGAGAGALIADEMGNSRTKGALAGALAGGLSCNMTGGCY